MVIILIRFVAAIGLALVGIFNLTEGETALGVVWIALAVVFGFLAIRRIQELRAQGEQPPEE